MKMYSFFRILLAWVCCLAYSHAIAQRPIIPAAPKLAAIAWLLADADSGRVLIAQNEDVQVPPASLTKIMTSYVAAYDLSKNRITLDDKVRVSKEAYSKPGSRMYIELGSRVRLEDILKGIVIQSGNDASVALAEHIAGAEDVFADIMNSHASQLGMENTHFSNSTGLSAEGHVSTAKDLWLLTRNLIQQFPDHYKLYSQKSFTYGTEHRTGKPIKQSNRNTMLWFDSSVDGVKTGYTSAAGYCLVVSAERSGMRLISVVLGAASEDARTRESQKLLNYGFRFFETVPILASGQEIEPRLIVYGGQKEAVGIGLEESLSVTIPRGERQDLVPEVIIDGDLWAPLKAGDQIGVLRTSLYGEIIAEPPIILLDSVKKSGFLKRVWDRARLTVAGLFEG